MTISAKDKLAYTVDEAAAATGYSPRSISRAIKAGSLATVSPSIGGKPIGKPVITAAELRRWLQAA